MDVEVLKACSLLIRRYLVNARRVRLVPGRKTDVQDSQWLRELHRFGLLNASFRPEQPW